MRKDQSLQVLRGLAIASVVLIHALPKSEPSILVRPFVNWAVAMFLFLSGLLSPEDRIREEGVVRRRLAKTMVPYLAWSILYWAAKGDWTPAALAKDLATGGAAAQMYYLLVYAQLVLLTPWLHRMLRTHRLALYVVTPISLVLRELLAVMGVVVPRVQMLFPLWLGFYVLGLDWPQIQGRMERLRILVVFLSWCLCVALQIASGLAWNSFGNYDLATTQLKVSSMVTSACFVLLLMRMRRGGVTSSVSVGLARLGDDSFGIYLCHIAVLVILRKVLVSFGLTGFVWAFPLWMMTLVVSMLLVAMCRRALPSRVLSVLGFA